MPRKKQQKTSAPTSTRATKDDLECHVSLGVAGVGLAALLGGLTYYFYGCAHAPEHRRRVKMVLKRMRDAVEDQAGALTSFSPSMLRQLLEKGLSFYEDVNGAAESGRKRTRRS